MIDLIYLMLGTFIFVLFLNQALDLGNNVALIALGSFIGLPIAYFTGRLFKQAWVNYRGEYKTKSKDEWDR